MGAKNIADLSGIVGNVHARELRFTEMDVNSGCTAKYDVSKFVAPWIIAPVFQETYALVRKNVQNLPSWPYFKRRRLPQHAAGRGGTVVSTI